MGEKVSQACVQWCVRLEALLTQRARCPFAWGRHDCCLFAADAVLAVCGVDHAAAWRGTYSTQTQADALLEELGGLSCVGAMAGPPIAPGLAGVGDIGLVHDGDRELLGVCVGMMWMVPAARGLAALPFSAARKAWRVSHA